MTVTVLYHGTVPGPDYGTITGTEYIQVGK